MASPGRRHDQNVPKATHVNAVVESGIRDSTDDAPLADGGGNAQCLTKSNGKSSAVAATPVVNAVGTTTQAESVVTRAGRQVASPAHSPNEIAQSAQNMSPWRRTR